MRFIDIPKTLKNEREEFVTKICLITLVDRSTVYRWLSGQVIPSKARREAISKELGISEEELFPLTIEKI